MPSASTLRAILAAPLWLTINWATVVWGCPNCKEGLLDNGQTGINLARGFELSIYLMLGAPLVILSTLAFIFYLQIRAAKRNGTYPEMSQFIAQVESATGPIARR